jgi:hypothetical protein
MMAKMKGLTRRFDEAEGFVDVATPNIDGRIIHGGE